MNNHVNLNVRVSREIHDELLRYCSKTGEKKARAVRRAIAALLAGNLSGCEDLQSEKPSAFGFEPDLNRDEPSDVSKTP